MDGFIETPTDAVPRVKFRMGWQDTLGTIMVRVGWGRNHYKIVPGLYGVGSPNPESPVMVTANYKLSFDSLRCALSNIDAWLLVIDTRGINVWCAAGKKTFSTSEIVYQVKKTRLAEIVSHRELILPQLAASGVTAHNLKKQCGFHGVFGPIRAKDMPNFLRNKTADEAMRSVSFTMTERLILIPVEISLIWKIFALVAIATFIVSGIGPNIYSLKMASQRGLVAIEAIILAVLTGGVAVPVFLPWLPGRQFWIKGIFSGTLGWLAFSASHNWGHGVIESTALFCWVMAISSYMAMNFTGATPFTSLSGVKYEMRRGLAVQCIGATSAAILWIISPFLAG